AAKDVEVPTQAEAKKVLEYYYHGKDKGPLLLELVACTKVDSGKNSPTKNECIEPVAGPVKKGTTVHAWTSWMVPLDGNYEDVIIQYLLDGQVRTTADVKISGGARSRTWRASTLSKAGKWDIKVLRGGTELASASITVQ
ncbi:MAG: hypothetical protein ACYC8T_36015, partial [Myxococcaceae bacterium]